MSKIARKLKIKERTVETCLKKCQIKKDASLCIITKDKEYKDPAILQKLIDKYRNASIIAELYDVHAKTIFYWINKHSIFYDSNWGRETKRHDPDKRKKMKNKRKAEKEKDRQNNLKRPDFNLGHETTLKTRCKLSVANVFSRRKKEQKEFEKTVARDLCNIAQGLQIEVPITFFDSEGNVINASRCIDFYYPKGTVNQYMSVAIQLDGAYMHGSEKNEYRDRILSQVAPRSGLILIRVWQCEVQYSSSQRKGTLQRLLRTASKMRKSCLVRHQYERIDRRTVKVISKIEAKRNFLGEPDLKFKILTEQNIERIKSKIDEDKWVSPEDIL